MDPQPAPFPGKTRPVKSRISQKWALESQKHTAKEPSTLSQKRTFGTIRTNILTKPGTEKNFKKGPKKESKSPKEMPISSVEVSSALRDGKSSDRDTEEVPISEETFTENKTDRSPEAGVPRSEKNAISKRSENETSEKARAKSKESGSSKEKAGKKISHKEAVSSPKTPSSLLKKSKTNGNTPYHSAMQCSKCRFDRLETSSYWLTQIKLAETGGKHFVAAAFFRLALESKAEPIRDIRVELRKYLRQHRYLSEQAEWKDLGFSYGLRRDEKNVDGADSGPGKPITAAEDECIEGEIDQKQDESLTPL